MSLQCFTIIFKRFHNFYTPLLFFLLVSVGISSSSASSHERSVSSTDSVTRLGGEFGGLMISHLVGQQLMLTQLYLLPVERNIVIPVTD